MGVIGHKVEGRLGTGDCCALKDQDVAIATQVRQICDDTEDVMLLIHRVGIPLFGFVPLKLAVDHDALSQGAIVGEDEVHVLLKKLNPRIGLW